MKKNPKKISENKTKSKFFQRSPEQFAVKLLESGGNEFVWNIATTRPWTITEFISVFTVRRRTIQVCATIFNYFSARSLTAALFISVETGKANAWYGWCVTFIETCCIETKSRSTTNAIANTKLQSSASITIVHGASPDIVVADAITSSNIQLQSDELLWEPVQWSASTCPIVVVHVSEYECQR